MRDVSDPEQEVGWEPDEEIQLTSPAQERALLVFAANRDYPPITADDLRAIVERAMKEAGRAQTR